MKNTWTRPAAATAITAVAAATIHAYALIGAGTGTFPDTAAGHLLAALLPAVFVAGAVPRRLLLGRRKLSGTSFWCFEVVRAAAFAAPSAALLALSPALVLTLMACIAVSAMIMRAVARKIIADRDLLRTGPLAAEADTGSLSLTRRANSVLIFALGALSLVGPVAGWLGGASFASLLIAPPVLCAVSVLLGFHSEHFRRAEAENAYDRHLEWFFSACYKDGVRDLIHYAGGSPDLVSVVAKRITGGGHGVAVLARDVPSFDRAAKLGLRCVLARKISDLDRIVSPQTLRVHYPNDTQRGGHMVRFSKLIHVYHAEKSPSSGGRFPEYFAMYDTVVTKAAPPTGVLSSATALGVRLVHLPKGAVSAPGIFATKGEPL